MNHPSNEAWMGYLYDDLPPADKAALSAHLESCSECRECVERWRATMAVLDTDVVEEAPPALEPVTFRRPSSRAILQWGLAASVVLFLGFALGRGTGISRRELDAELARMRDTVTQELREQYREDLREVARTTIGAAGAENRELLSRVVGEFNQARAVDRRDWLATLERLEDKRELQYQTLRDGVVELARSTQSGFRQTENNLNLLAATLPLDGGDGAGTSKEPSLDKEKLP